MFSLSSYSRPTVAEAAQTNEQKPSFSGGQEWKKSWLFLFRQFLSQETTKIQQRPPSQTLTLRASNINKVSKSMKLERKKPLGSATSTSGTSTSYVCKPRFFSFQGFFCHRDTDTQGHTGTVPANMYAFQVLTVPTCSVTSRIHFDRRIACKIVQCGPLPVAAGRGLSKARLSGPWTVCRPAWTCGNDNPTRGVWAGPLASTALAAKPLVPWTLRSCPPPCAGLSISLLKFRNWWTPECQPVSQARRWEIDDSIKSFERIWCWFTQSNVLWHISDSVCSPENELQNKFGG